MYKAIFSQVMILTSITSIIPCIARAADIPALDKCIQEKISAESKSSQNDSAIALNGNWRIDHCYHSDLINTPYSLDNHSMIIVKIVENGNKFHGVADVGTLIAVRLVGKSIIVGRAQTLSFTYTYHPKLSTTSIWLGSCNGRVQNSNAIYWECKDNLARIFLNENPRFIWKRVQ